MLIHALIHWPEIIQESFWPYAIQLAVDIHNSTPTASGLTPMEIFSGTKSHTPTLHNFHPFGCPIFVLEPSLRQNHKIPRWKPRSRIGVYLGHSPIHASSVPLVYSTTTGLISPLFHVVFDDKFTTVKCLHTNQLPSNWPVLFNTSSTFYVDEDFTKTNFYQQDSFQDFTQPSSDPSLQFQRESPNTTQVQEQSLPSLQPSFQPNLEESISSEREIPTISAIPDIESIAITPDTMMPPNTHTGWNQSHRYNTRFKKQHIAAIAPFHHHHDFNDNTINAYLSSNDLFSTNDHNLSDAIHHHVFTASHKDTLHFGEFHQDPDREHFELDMQCEMTDLLSTKTIELTHRSLVPSENKPLNPIWSFRHKRAPDWTVIKHRSRICPDGGKQIEGINFWATYAPVVSWRTVHLTLILSLLSGLKS
jgi:hypothetical protein